MGESTVISPKRYLDVRALFLSWKGADKAFYEQLVLLKNVLQDEYNFGVEDWAIPHDDPFFQLNGRLRQFLQSDDYDTLLILYYGGHGSTDTDRNALWMCYDRADTPRLSWSSLQPLLFNKKSDILMIFDCCSAGSAVCAPGEGVIEGVFASGVGGRTPLSGKNTFTRNLVDRLRRSDCFTQSVTAYRLYHDLAQNLKLSNDSTRQHGVSPHYLRLAERKNEFRTIQLARLPSFYTAEEMSGSSVPSALTQRAMSFATARSTPTLEIIDMHQRCERIQLPNVSRISSARSLNMAKMANSDAYSIQHSVFRGCYRVSEQSLPWHGQEGTQTGTQDTQFPLLEPQLGQCSLPDLISQNEKICNTMVEDYLASGLLKERTEMPLQIVRDYPTATDPELPFMSRLLHELLDVQREATEADGSEFYTVAPISNNLLEWKGTLKGPPGSPYEGGIFHVCFSIHYNRERLALGFPFERPKVRFITKIYHPNINKFGTVWADWGWSPAYTLSKLCVCLCAILSDPNWEDPVMEIGEEYRENPELCYRKAKEWTEMYATGQIVFPENGRVDGYYNTTERPLPYPANRI
ncbi:hypothetical protein BFJ69_g12383 [Fusarium oxysporum]|uniref:UBC core domain-containing protein n=1 Tax=Fusarium oxysporum TaxID=5507 RepID=A0A420MP54_FUSOX|nr:hypothetical protein BFJ69_g12383 [Fusarium oxysporum]